MTRPLYLLATVLYAAARGLEWVASKVHVQAHRRSITKLPTAKPHRPRSVS